MTNNDILRRLRYIFDISDSKMIALFAKADYAVTREQLSCWLKKEDDPSYKNCGDHQLAHFLNGFISVHRGQKEGPAHPAEKRLNNNIIFRKLKIALNLKDDEILAILDLANLRVSRHELSAFFRKPEHKHFRECKDQILRNFLYGMQLKYRDKTE
ncbi:YehS family protein [Dongshaea marina]|uniref:DUF1456 family protein n=1 Tax=Dongshaea marina TaxID=2047966 RepID=UPI000D3E7418|nr:DUF1456 family protein [Dongshaea marina]